MAVPDEIKFGRKNESGYNESEDMPLIITIGREFGSGGRELGRRLAENLRIAYYDREILWEIEKKTPYCLSYIEEATERRPTPLLPIHYGRTFSFGNDPAFAQSLDIYQAQSEIIKEVAMKGPCVIIGRCADAVLKDFAPVRLFIYADWKTKLKRVRSREGDQGRLTDKAIAKKAKSIDKARRKYYEFYTGHRWGDPHNYDLMINTSNLEIKEIASSLAHLFEKDLTNGN